MNSGTPAGPVLQPPATSWPNRPSYDQSYAQAPTSPGGAPQQQSNQQSGFGPTSSGDSSAGANSNEWYNPPTGQAPRSGYQNRNQPYPGSNAGGQSRYGERDLFGRQTQNSPSFSTQAKHSNALNNAEEEITAVAETKPWVLVVALLALFASIGLNVYLGMVSWDLYERYRVTIDQLKAATEARVA
jgi:hypothetical protein